MFSYAKAAISARQKQEKDFLEAIQQEPFPYLHPKVDLNHLYPNHRLLPDATIASVKAWFETNKNKNIYRRKNDSGKTIQIIRLIHPTTNIQKLYAVYFKDKNIGCGAFGSVRLMQDLESSEWFALKVMTYEPEDAKRKGYYNDAEHVAKEIKNLNSLGLSLGVIDRRINKNKAKKMLGMPLMPGENLHKFIKANPILTQTQWLSLAAHVSNCVLAFYQNGYLHLDIKPDNFMYDRRSNQVHLIDYSFLAKGPVLKTTSSYGTDNFIAPEFDGITYNGDGCEIVILSSIPTEDNLDQIPLRYNKAFARADDKLLYLNSAQSLVDTIPLPLSALAELDKTLEIGEYEFNSPRYLTFKQRSILQLQTNYQPTNIFSEKSMVYALSVTLAEILGLDGKFRGYSKLEDSKLRKEIAAYINRMKCGVAKDRPNLHEVVAFFNEALLQSKEIIMEVRKIGILNVDEYFASEDNEQKQLKTKLKLVDEVWFVDAERAHSDQYYVLRRQLEEENIQVGRHLFYSVSSLSDLKIIQLIPSMAKYEDSLKAYFFITAKERPKELKMSLEKSGMTTLDRDVESSCNEVNHYLYSKCLIKEQYVVVTQLLLRKIEKQKAKYGEQNEIANKRIEKIHSALYTLENYFLQGKLNLTLLNKILSELANVVLSTAIHVKNIINEQAEYAATHTIRM